MSKAALSIASGIALVLLLAPGCETFSPEQPYSHYHSPRLDWAVVNRVLLMPLDNETPVNQAAEEVRQALSAELQSLGQFEVVSAPPDVLARASHLIRDNGRFNEAVLVDLARCTRADLIVLGAISQYHPYRLPRLGLVLQVVSPADGVVVASVDGLWDTTHKAIARQARAYYKEDVHGRDDSFTDDLALEAPRYFQRYVCHEAVQGLVEFTPARPVARPGVAPPGAGPAAPVPLTAKQDPAKSPFQLIGTEPTPRPTPAAPDPDASRKPAPGPSPPPGAT
jgi:nucleotide-binding universal stress UspA family protein